jgi:cytochrome c peroxidase
MKSFSKYLVLVLMLLSGVIAFIALDIYFSNKLPDFATEFTSTEISKIQKLGRLLPTPKDETNKLSGNTSAIEFGTLLFKDKRFSKNNNMSCSTCHDSENHWTSSIETKLGIPSLWNVGHHRWFFWDGRIDTLWGQVVQPLEDPNEMNFSRTSFAKIISSDSQYRKIYEDLFTELIDLKDFPSGAKPGNELWAQMPLKSQQTVNHILINCSKAIAAFEETIKTRKTSFNIFTDGIAEKDQIKMNQLSADAQKGLKLFIGKGQCKLCHSSPLFTDFEFHDIHLGLKNGQTELEPARMKGVKTLRIDPFNSLGEFSDNTKGPRAEQLTYLRLDPESIGHFKTPSLINIEHTAPYMHDDRYRTLEEVIDFYSEMKDASPLQTHKERVIKPAKFTIEEKKHLLAFLKSLSEIEP